jgi:hypothetical protein
MGNPCGKPTNRPWGVQHIVLFVPAARKSPDIAIATKRMIRFFKKGGQGDAPRMLRPPLGERGGRPPGCCREYAKNRKMKVSTEP